MSLELVSLEEFYTDIYQAVPGCPEMTIENNVRAAAITFCEQTQVVHFDMDPLTTVAGQREYDFEVPDAEYMVHGIVAANYDGTPLTVLSERIAAERFPRYREYNGSPNSILRKNSTTFWLYPTPDATKASSLFLTVSIKPTPASEFVPELLLNDHKQTIVSGALARLLLLPNKDWTDKQLAGVHMASFATGILDAKKRARRADEGAAAVAQYGGIGGRKRYQSRRRY